LISQGEEYKISCEEIIYEKSQSQVIKSPICAFYVKKDVDDSKQLDLRVIEEVEKDGREERFREEIEEVKINVRHFFHLF